MPDVFISYSRRDKEFVQRLGEALEARGKDVWVDWEDIPASSQWRREIEDGIDATDAFLFVISPDSVVSNECGQELEHALQRNKRILPIVRREVDPTEVRSEAAAINWVYLRDEDPFEDGVLALVNALNTDLEHTKAHTRLAGEAIDWERSGHDRSRLLRGSELQDAERWLTAAAAKQPLPTELQAQFVQASREAARRRGRILFAGVGFALVVAVALAVVALIQRANAVHQSNVAYSRQLDADAQKNYPTDPELSVLLAMQAAQTAPGGPTEEGLRQALAQSHVRDRYTNPDAGHPIGDAVWSPDGSRLAVVDQDADRTEIVRPGTHDKPIVLKTPGLNNQLSWAGHRNVLLTGSAAPAIWNGTTGARIHSLPTRAVQAAMSPNGRVAATADLHGVVHLWDVSTGHQLAQAAPAFRDTPGCLIWSPDGSKLAVCTIHISEQLIAENRASPETVTVFDAKGRRLSVIHEPTIIDQLAFSPDGRRLAMAITPESPNAQKAENTPGTYVYDARTGARQLVLGGHPASTVAFSPDGSKLAFAELLGGIAYVYTFQTGRTVPLVGTGATVSSIQFSHSGVYVVTTAADNAARVFNATFGNQLEVMAGDNQTLTDASWSPDDTEIATASKDGTARVWTTPAPRPIAQRKLSTGLGQVTVSPDGKTTVAAGPDSPVAWVLDTATLDQRAALTPPTGQAFSGAGFSADGRWIGALTGRLVGRRPAQHLVSEQLRIYDERTGLISAAIAPAGRRVTAGAFGRHADVATILSNGQVDTWSAATGHHEQRLLPAGKAGQTISYSADGSRLAVTHPDGSIDLLSRSGARPQTIHGPAPKPVYPTVPSSAFPVRAAFSPDGRWLAAVGGGSTDHGRVYVWNLASGRRLTLTAGLTPLVSVAFNASGTMLAAGDASNAYVWAFPSGALIQTLNQGASSTYGIVAELAGTAGVSVGFTKTGTLLTSGDFTTRDWRISTGQIEFDAPFSEGGVSTQDGQRLVVNVAGVLGTYRCDLCGGLSELMDTAHRQVTRSLSPTERALYLRRG